MQATAAIQIGSTIKTSGSHISYSWERQGKVEVIQTRIWQLFSLCVQWVEQSGALRFPEHDGSVYNICGFLAFGLHTLTACAKVQGHFV